MAQMTPEDVRKLKADLYTKVADLVETFKLQTGFGPSGIEIRMADVTSLSESGTKNFVVSGVDLRWTF